MNPIEQIQNENEKIIAKMNELAQTEDSRVDVVSAVFVRTNRDMRFKNMQDIKSDIRDGAKFYGQLPEKYAVRQESITKSYVEQINRFMRQYNEQYINIQTHIYRAEEMQKVLMFKSCKVSNTKTVYMLTDDYLIYKNKKNLMIEEYKKTNDSNLYQKIQDYKNPCDEYDRKIEEYKNQIKLYENIITRCDKEFEDCKIRRDRDFEEIFGMEKAMTISEKKNLIQKIFFNFMNRVDGYNKFSKYVLQKYANKINEIKISKMDTYVTKIKQDMINFSNEIDKMIGENS